MDMLGFTQALKRYHPNFELVKINNYTYSIVANITSCNVIEQKQ